MIAGAFELVKTAISGNQKLMDGINTAFTAFNIVVNDVVNVLTDTFTAVNEATGGFDAIKEVMSSLVTVALTPIKLGFYAIKLGIQEAQLIWEESTYRVQPAWGKNRPSQQVCWHSCRVPAKWGAR